MAASQNPPTLGFWKPYAGKKNFTKIHVVPFLANDINDRILQTAQTKPNPTTRPAHPSNATGTGKKPHPSKRIGRKRPPK